MTLKKRYQRKPPAFGARGITLPVSKKGFYKGRGILLVGPKTNWSSGVHICPCTALVKANSL